jgi:hypothetical protein
MRQVRVTLSHLRFSAVSGLGKSLGISRSLRRLVTRGGATGRGSGLLTSLLAHYPLAMEDHPAMASHRRATLLEKGLVPSSSSAAGDSRDKEGGGQAGAARRQAAGSALETSHELDLVRRLHLATVATGLVRRILYPFNVKAPSPQGFYIPSV